MEPLLILALLVFAFLTYRYSKIFVRKDISAANKRLAIVFYLIAVSGLGAVVYFNV
ncbi:hypothetical protein [Exiguobacterium sp. KKBO11]|uniref:hypothetical protein n=1 Tax=Exiguobacterium sp. KKBO11 TaxID=1805000 RepID=UPI000AEED879|nr:hypothetical protein [Exiguobacterium sp. KKBO11]